MYRKGLRGRPGGVMRCGYVARRERHGPKATRLSPRLWALRHRCVVPKKFPKKSQKITRIDREK
jgi:hypothetical protein